MARLLEPPLDATPLERSTPCESFSSARPPSPSRFSTDCARADTRSRRSYCPPDAAGRASRTRSRRARCELGIPVHQHRTLKGADVAREVAGYRRRPRRARLRDADRAAGGVRGAAPGQHLLPSRRCCRAIAAAAPFPGRSSRARRAPGVSVFWVDPGIDTGPILLQKRGRDRSRRHRRRRCTTTRSFQLGVDAVLESVDLIAAGAAPRIAQDESQATYDPLCRDEHAAIDWRASGRRGLQPHPRLRSAARRLRAARRRRRCAATTRGAPMRRAVAPGVDRRHRSRTGVGRRRRRRRHPRRPPARRRQEAAARAEAAGRRRSACSRRPDRCRRRRKRRRRPLRRSAS